MFFTFLLSTVLNFTNVYSLQFTDIDGNTIQMSDYVGKKILFVNTASSCVNTNQYTDLEQLYQLYHDSLVVIAFPSNSFGHELSSNTEIKDFVIANYNIHFILAAKVSVTGEDISPIYNWLTKASENGAMDNNVDTDFFKYLVNENGKLVAAFADSVDPMSENLRTVIEAW